MVGAKTPLRHCGYRISPAKLAASPPWGSGHRQVESSGVRELRAGKEGSGEMERMRLPLVQRNGKPVPCLSLSLALSLSMASPGEEEGGGGWGGTNLHVLLEGVLVHCLVAALGEVPGVAQKDPLDIHLSAEGSPGGQRDQRGGDRGLSGPELDYRLSSGPDGAVSWQEGLSRVEEDLVGLRQPHHDRHLSVTVPAVLVEQRLGVCFAQLHPEAMPQVDELLRVDLLLDCDPRDPEDLIVGTRSMRGAGCGAARMGAGGRRVGAGAIKGAAVGPRDANSDLMLVHVDDAGDGNG